MNSVIVSFVLFSVMPFTLTDFNMRGPKEAKSVEEIMEVAKKEDLAGGLRSESHVSKIEYENANSDQKTLVVWYNPYSGRAACHAYLYEFDSTKRVWVQKMAQRFDETANLSIEFGSDVKFRDQNGKVIKTYPEK